MAIIVEDGTGKSNANAYCDFATFSAYCSERGIVHSFAQEQVEAALVISAKDWIDGEHNFANYPLTNTQSMKFPRAYTNQMGFVVYGVPSAIVLANCKAAWLELNGLLRVDLAGVSLNGVIESESSSLGGGLSESITYKSGTSQAFSRVIPNDLKNLLSPYLEGGFSGMRRG